MALVPCDSVALLLCGSGAFGLWALSHSVPLAGCSSPTTMTSCRVACETCLLTIVDRPCFVGFCFCAWLWDPMHTKNSHITVGHNTMPIRVLWDVYGDNLCPAPLMSIRFGNARFYCCDQAHDPDHCSLFSSDHQLPPVCCPQDSVSWNRYLRASNQGVRQHKRNNDKEKDRDARAVIKRSAGKKKKKSKQAAASKKG